MDTKAFYKLSYGVFLLSVKDERRINGCVINTCVQVASNPTRIAISCINNNFSCELLKKSGKFTLSVFDNTVSFDTIKHFGLQSGRDVDKFKDFQHELNPDGIPYITKNVCAVMHCNVVSKEDLGSHTLFVATVDDAQVLSQNAPLTYSDYQTKLKPRPANASTSQNKKIVAWKCKICGYVYKGEKLPDGYLCPLCGHSSDDFEPVYE